MKDDSSPRESRHVERQVRRGVPWAMVVVGGRVLLSTVVTRLLSAHLTAEDYGLFGMIATLSTLLTVFGDFGLGTATIQSSSLSAGATNNLFWINSLVGTLLWLLCGLVAYPLSDFFGHIELLRMTQWFGASFLLAGMAAQPIAILKRKMAFAPIAVAELGSSVLGAVAAIVAALCGWHAWALIVQPLVNHISRVVLAFAFSAFRPRRPTRTSDTLSLVRFGSFVVLNDIAVYCLRNIDSVLIGKIWGAAALGLYNRAYVLMLLPSNLGTGALNQVMVPALSALRSDRDAFEASYYRALRFGAALGCPASVGLGLTAHQAVRLFYGDAWTPVAPLLCALSVGGALQPVFNSSEWLFLATGRVRGMVILNSISAVFLSVAFFLAVQSGPSQVAIAFSVGSIVAGIAMLWSAHQVSALSLRKTLLNLLPIILATASMAVVVLGVSAWLIERVAWYVHLALAAASGAGTYGLTLRALLGRGPFLELFSGRGR